MTATLVLGPPGTGKTYRLLSEMEAALARGVRPDRIAFVSFTRAAVGVARERAKDRFGLSDDDLPLFRTLHSLAFHRLGLRRGDVFGREALSHLSELTGEALTGKYEMDVPTLGERGDALLFLDQYARAAGVSLEDAWQAHGSPIDWFRLKRFVDAYALLRRDLGLVDFTDMLERAVASETPTDADLALLDEAQDLTPLQWRWFDVAFGDADRIVMSGDDDQAIYHWAGSSVDRMLSFTGPREVLHRSHRLPRAVWQIEEESH